MANPLAPHFLRTSFDHDSSIFGFRPLALAEKVVQSKFIRGARNLALSMGDVLSEMAIAGPGSILESSYAITSFSEHVKLQSWRLSHEILTYDRDKWDKLLNDIA